MKKSLTMVLCLGLSLLLCGCGLEQLKEKYIEETGITPTPTSAPKERVYMDQYTGKVQTFDGINLVLQSDGRSVLFDASQASIETSHGLVTGDEVSVIYEGRLDSPGSTEVKALKVVDDLHKETKLEEQTITGTLTRLTQNSLLFTDQSGRSILCPVTGASQYYSAGIREGISITVRYLGTIPDVDPGYGLTLEVPQVRVLSVSDTGSIPSKPKRSSSARVSNEYGDEYTVSTAFSRGHIRSLDTSTLQLIPNGANEIVTLDLSAAECWFGCGACSGSGLDLVFSGAASDSSLDGAYIHTAIGDDPASLDPGSILSYVSGEIVGMTANTITLRTEDKMNVTVRTDNVQNTAGDLLYGKNVRVLFDPAASRETNVLISIRIRNPG